MLSESICKLVQYGVETGLTPECERNYTINLLLDVFKEEEYIKPEKEYSNIELEEVLQELSISTGMNRAELSASSSGAESSSNTPVLPSLLPQQTEGKLPDAYAANALEVTLDFQGQGTTRFRYDPDLSTYTMLHPDGSPRTDANTSAPVAFDNLLVLYSSSSLRDDSRTLDYDLTMGGGVWLNEGHLWHITWTQGTSSTFAFYDADGSPLRIKSGRSYIALLSSLTGQELLVQSGTGEALVGAG